MVRPLVRARPFFSEDDIQNILRRVEAALRSGILIMGQNVKDFEAAFAASVGVRHAIAVNSGTAALEIALRCLDVKGKEVIVPTETFVASANSVFLAGGRPVFAEIHPDTLCLDVEDVRRRITPQTAGVMAVHMAGLIQPDIAALEELCDQNGLFLLEDAAHAHGASINGRKAGSLGCLGCFSFYPTKVITTGEGGMITVNDETLAELARSYRNHGANPNATDYVRVSTNWRMPEASAAIGLVQFSHLDEFVDRRNQIAARYNAGLCGVRGIRLLPAYDHIRHSYWNYLLMLDPGVDRAALAQELAESYGIPVAWPYEPACHLQPVFREALGTGPGDLSASEAILARHLALPMHVALTDDDVDYIIDGVIKAVRKSV